MTTRLDVVEEWSAPHRPGSNPAREPRGVMGWGVRRMLLDYVKSMNELAKEPQFYNAGTDNCTTNIRMHAQQIGATAPWDYRILLNGYLDEMLYERGTIDTSRPFPEVKAGSLIDARAQAADQDPDFSRRIREGITVPRRFDETDEASRSTTSRPREGVR